MRKLRLYILIPLVALLCMMCSSEEENAVDKQVTNIENFLSNYDYDHIDNTVYRLIVDTDQTDRSKVAEVGDSVIFEFAGYQFTTQRIEPAFYTNVDWILQELRESGLNTLYWEQDPVAVKIGDSKLIKALEAGITGDPRNGISGCRQGDSVRLFLTSDVAYGAHYISNIPLYSAVEYVLWINEVKKQ